jgi:hypothetical protein
MARVIRFGSREGERGHCAEVVTQAAE